MNKTLCQLVLVINIDGSSQEILCVFEQETKGGWWYGTTSAHRGLLVAEPTFDEAVGAVSRAWLDLQRAERMR